MLGASRTGSSHDSSTLCLALDPVSVCLGVARVVVHGRRLSLRVWRACAGIGGAASVQLLPSQPRYCSQCGNPLVAGARFCCNCGVAVVAVPVMTTAADSVITRSLPGTAWP